MYDELEEVFQGELRDLTTQDLSRMKYLHLVIKESLRIFPSVPIIIRKLGADITVGK